MNAIDKLRERDTVEANILVELYDERRQTACFDGSIAALENLARRIVNRLAQDEEPEGDISF